MASVRKYAGITVAKMAGESSAMDDAASDVEAAAKQNARGHGSLPSRISTRKVRGPSNVKDRLVSLDHPEAGFIEFGHLAPDGSWVPGLWIMKRAVDDV